MIEYNIQLFGGRGSSSRNGSGGGSGQAINANGGNSVSNQAPNANNTFVTPGGVTTISQMTDDDRANLINASKNVDMPNHLSDVTDATQKFVYQAGLNEKPQVLDKAGFDKYMRDNNIPKSQILSRTVSDSQPYYVNGTRYQLTGAQIQQMTRDSQLNYIGGKHGGQVHGAGTYFDMNGGRSTGYGSGRGSATMRGVLSKNARVVDESTLRRNVSTWQRNNPKSAKAIGSYNNKTMSIYALSMGYNVIRYSSYHNVIDRSALVLDSTNY